MEDLVELYTECHGHKRVRVELLSILHMLI